MKTKNKDIIPALYNATGIYLVAGLLILTGSLISDNFLSAENFLDILHAIAILGITASGMAFVTYSGNLADLSIPAIIAFSGIITVASLPLGIVAALILGILAGMAIGALNGLVIGCFNANPILWTLAVSFFMEGFMRFACSNNQVYPNTEPGSSGAAFIRIFRINIGPVPLIVCVMLALFCIGTFVMTKTKFGIETKFVGSSREAAKSSGINIKRIVFFDFLAASFAASIAGIFITSLNKLGVFSLGKGYDFKSITAVVIGGMALSGGRGHMPGVLGGVIVIGLLANVMTFMRINIFQQNIVTGAVFILVVGLHQYQLRKRGKDYE